MRLAKYLAHSGVASRRKAEQLIAAGRVRVGGEVVRDPARDVEFESGVEVDGKPVSPESREVWMLNKPADVVSTASEPGRRRAVTELIDSAPAPVSGRSPRRRVDRADPADQRRRARQPPDASPLRGRRAPIGSGCAARPMTSRARAAARRRRARRRADGAGAGAPRLAARDRDDDARGPQPPGPADGRGDRQRGGRARAHRLRPAAPRRPARRARRAGCAPPSCAGSGRMRAR